MQKRNLLVENQIDQKLANLKLELKPFLMNVEQHMLSKKKLPSIQFQTNLSRNRTSLQAKTSTNHDEKSSLQATEQSLA
jgi:hypothetical protein